MENSEFQEDFKCPICFEIPPKEIYQCKNGHTLCDDCSQTLKECPQCRVPFEQTKIRTRALEQLLDKLKFDCPFKSQGCNDKFKRSEISSHSEKCTFGNTGTKFCQQLGYHCNYFLNPSKLNEAIHHFREQHDFIVCRDKEVNIYMEGVSSSQTKGYWTPIVFDLESKDSPTWILLTVVGHDNKTVSPICIQLNENRTTDNRIEFQIQGDESSEIPDITWSNPLFPIKNASFALHHPVLQLTMDSLLPFYIKNFSLEFKCSTHNKNNPFGSSNEELETIHTFPNSSISFKNVFTLASIQKQNESKQKCVKFMGTFCDICKQTPESIRYKCLECEDYDLCKICMEKKEHGHHVFAVIRNLEQQIMLRSNLILGNKWVSFFPPMTALMLKASGVFSTQNVNCCKCKSNSSTFICLHCSPLYGYCGPCWSTSSSEHDQDHVFAWGNNQAKLNLIIGYYYHKQP